MIAITIPQTSEVVILDDSKLPDKLIEEYVLIERREFRYA